MYEAEQTILVTAAGGLVPEFDEAGKWQLVSSGSRIPLDVAMTYGLVTGDMTKGYRVTKAWGGTIVDGMPSAKTIKLGGGA